MSRCGMWELGGAQGSRLDSQRASRSQELKGGIGMGRWPGEVEWIERSQWAEEEARREDAHKVGDGQETEESE